MRVDKWILELLILEFGFWDIEWKKLLEVRGVGNGCKDINIIKGNVIMIIEEYVF